MSVALTLTFAQTQVFISMLCAMKHAIFVFYTGWVLGSGGGLQSWKPASSRPMFSSVEPHVTGINHMYNYMHLNV
jgi:hypothetical protein